MYFLQLMNLFKVIIFIFSFMKKVAPYWPQNVEDCLTVGGFKIKTEAVESSLDYITRIMTVERDVSNIFCFVNVSYTKYAPMR